MNEFRNGFFTGLSLQLAIGPVFFLIVNLTLQKSWYDGFAGVCAVTMVDALYIASSVSGVVRILGNPRWRTVSGITGAVFLMVFGGLILLNAGNSSALMPGIPPGSGVLASFGAVFLVTLFNPMTIVFFSSLFTVKAVEYNYSEKQLVLFGTGTAFATFAFMGGSVMVFSMVRGFVPVFLMQVLNSVVGLLLVGYGFWGIVSGLKGKNEDLPAGKSRE